LSLYLPPCRADSDGVEPERPSRSAWRIALTTRRTSRDMVDIVGDAQEHIATYVQCHHAEQIIAALNGCTDDLDD
jgi:hypothetical protein